MYRQIFHSQYDLCVCVCVCARACVRACVPVYVWMHVRIKGFRECGWLLATTPGGSDPQPVK